MKNTKILLFSLAAILSGNALMAQNVQNWKTNGNSLNAAGKLGTANAQDVNFITNNIPRFSIKKNGTLRVNSDQISIQFPNPGATPKPMMFMYESGNTNTARMVMAYSPSFPNYGLKYNGFDKFDFTDGGNIALDIDLTNDRVGVGTGLPKTRLHVLNGASGASPTANTTLTLENSTNNYVSLLTPNTSESGILFGNAANNASGGIIYNSQFSGTKPNGMQFRTNGNIPRMVLTSEGKLALGPSLDPSIYRMKVDLANAFGFDIANSTFGTDWEIFAGTAGLSLFVDGGAGGPKGQFSRSTGVYSALSDERAKTNIKPMTNVLEKIRQLKATSYQFKNSKDQQQYDGFIAQQVMKIFPSLVTHNVEPSRDVDQYLLNYSGFGVIAIKGIQELMKQNDSLKSEIENLKSEVAQIKTMLQKGDQSTGAGAGLNATISTSLTNASLGQNVPNPFVNSTAINYTLPQKFSKANLLVADRSGKTIKQINLTGTGKGRVNVDASLLLPGTYNYSLIVDGKTIDSKQMIIAK